MKYLAATGKYLLPLSIILFYTVTVERVVSPGLLLEKAPVFGFPFIHSEDLCYTTVRVSFPAELGNVFFLLAIVTVVYFAVRKFIHIKDRNIYTILLWAIVLFRLAVSYYRDVSDFRPCDYDFAMQGDEHTWRFVFFSLSY